MMADISLVTVVHPKAMIYFPQFLESVASQTTKNYELIVFYQNLTKSDVETVLKRFNLVNYETVEIDEKQSISKGREFVMHYLRKKNIDIILFLDSDDFINPTYVSELSKFLFTKKEKIVFTDVTLYYSETGKMVPNYFSGLVLPEIDLNFILEKNCLGLGNTGIWAELLDGLPAFPSDIIAVDWWMFTNILSKYKTTAKFVPTTSIYYRLYERNTAGFSNLSRERIFLGAKVKKLHYENLKHLGDPFVSLYDDYSCLYKQLNKNPTFAGGYIKYVMEKYKNRRYLWWEPIEIPRWLIC